MKKTLIYLTTLALLIFTSCESKLVFSGAQPEGIEVSTRFDEAYYGNYFCESDSSIITIEPKVIHQWKYINFNLTTAEIAEDENILFVGEGLYINGYDGCFIYRIKNDTVYASLPVRDTLFLVDHPTCVLKSYNNHQILNFKVSDEKWETMILSIDKETNITLLSAKLPEDIAALEKITPVTDISLEDKEQYIISPTLMEFDEILTKELVFNSCEYFPRVNVDELFDLLGIVKRNVQ